MRLRLLRLFTLLISLALTGLPLQAAFAAPLVDVDTPHCQNDTTTVAGSQESSFSSAGKISHSCCCDQCDVACSTHCDSCSAVTFVILPGSNIIVVTGHEAFFSMDIGLTSRSTPPPLPPPLS